MTDFRPLLDQVFRGMDAKTERDVKWVFRVAHLDADEFLSIARISPFDAFKLQIGGGIAIGVNGLKRWFPDVAVPGLGKCLLVPLLFSAVVGLTQRPLINPPIFAHMKIQRKMRRFDAEVFI